jgi:tetratricopeptide (TPR) repeat protein
MRERVSARDRAASGWLFGPVSDLLFGCGLAYAAVFALQCAAGSVLRDAIPLGALPLAALLVSTPHYGATLLRVYDDAREREAHAWVAIWGTLALCAMFWVGLRSHAVGSFVVTLYLTWSPWHYTAQNYGVALLLLRKRGATPTPTAQRWLQASFVISYGLAFLSLHGQPTPAYAPDGFTGYALDVQTLNIPAGLRDPAIAVGALAWLATAAAALVQLGRKAGARAIAPSLFVVLSQSLWFVLPVVARNFALLPGVEPLGLEHAQYAFLWIALAHAAQYVWITASYAESTARSRSARAFYFRSLAVGSAAWTAPALLFAPGVLGRLPFDAGLGVLVAALVNLHHFMLDGAIWKLRDKRVAEPLLAGAPTRATPPPAPARARRPVRALIGAFGVLSLGISAVGAYELNLGAAKSFERGDVERLERAERQLRWIGRASPELNVKVGLLRMQNGELDEAGRAFDKSLALYPTAAAHVGRGYLAARRGRFREALDGYDAALALDPGHVEALYQSGFALWKLGRVPEARARIQRAHALEPANERVNALLDELGTER